ncbi:MAG: EamA family transporter [Terriglobia bacterium]
MSETRAAAHPSRAKVLLAFAAVYLIWGSTYLAIRYAVETIPPLFMAGCRFVIAGATLYLLTRARGATPPSRRHWAGAAILGALLLVSGNGGLCWAEQRVPSGLAALLLATIPIWMVLLDSLRKGGTKLDVRVIGGMAIGVAGLALLVGPAHLWGSSRVDLAGAGVLMFSSFSWSLGSILSHKLELPPSPFLAAAMEMLAGGALLLLLGVLSGEGRQFHLHGVVLRSLLGLVYLIVAGSLLGFTAYIWLLRTVATARVSTYAFVNPAVAVFLGWAGGGEALTARELLASGTIIAGVALIITHRPSPVAVTPDTEGLPSEKAESRNLTCREE